MKKKTVLTNYKQPQNLAPLFQPYKLRAFIILLDKKMLRLNILPHHHLFISTYRQ